jgi:hypothetical protein
MEKVKAAPKDPLFMFRLDAESLPGVYPPKSSF